MFRRWLLVLSALLICYPALSAQTAGKIGKLLPGSFLTHETATAEAKVADPVSWNDFLRTNEQGRMQFDLADGTLVTVGAKSDLRVVKHDAWPPRTLGCSIPQGISCLSNRAASWRSHLV